ncbi:MurR/RpiR family transcriptional regulator [Bradyrhizobium sp. USDA 10063]
MGNPKQKRLAATTQLVRSGTQRLSKSARNVIAYVESHPNAVLVSSAADLASCIGASDATVIRAIQSLGYEGLPHLKSVIAAKLDAGTRDAPDKVSTTVKTLNERHEASPFALTVEAYAHSLEMLRHSHTDLSIAAAGSVLGKARRIALYGAGPSAMILQQTAIHLNRIGRHAYLLAGAGGYFADSLLQIQKGDALLVLAYGQVQKEGMLAQKEIRKHGGDIVVITDNPTGRMASQANAIVVVPRTEVGNMTLYGTILMTLESIVLSLTREEPKLALATAGRLRDFRVDLAVTPKDDR